MIKSYLIVGGYGIGGGGAYISGGEGGGYGSDGRGYGVGHGYHRSSFHLPEGKSVNLYN